MALGACALLLLDSGIAAAAPARVIILRHGEKKDDFRLCKLGIERAMALVKTYLGQGAKDSFFAAGERPAAFVSITLHALELAAPAATSWGQPVVLFTVLPGETRMKGLAGFRAALATHTEEAARLVMNEPSFNGRTVVMVWEHEHIANAKLEAQSPNRKISLRQLLRLDILPDVPTTWPTETYDYFWIVDFNPDGTPTRFAMKKQVFDGPFANLPANDWDKTDGLGKASGCLR